ncbi:MAG: hypothetical protein JF591_10480 [Lysobacter sp.]|nr:hypothetical protein [Lysobacter sp.]
MNALVRSALVATLALQSACVSMVASKYQPGLANAEILSRRLDAAPLRVGRFSADPKLDSKPLNVRGSTLSGGEDGKFSTYLRDALSTELRTAGRLDDNAASEISGELLQNRLNSGGAAAGDGQATVQARFVIKRDGAQVYDRTLTADHHWPSSFMGPIAIPAAFDNYTATVQKLLQQLFSDPQFERATAR